MSKRHTNILHWTNTVGEFIEDAIANNATAVMVYTAGHEGRGILQEMCKLCALPLRRGGDFNSDEVTVDELTFTITGPFAGEIIAVMSAIRLQAKNI